MKIHHGPNTWNCLWIPCLLGLIGLGSMASNATAQQTDPLADEIRSAERDREAALRELEVRRAEYLEALRRAEALDRRESMRPSYVNPYTQYGAQPFVLSEAYRAQAYSDAARSYLPRPAAPMVGGVPGASGVISPYGSIPINPVAPYGYGYNPRPLGGIDIPFGFGLGGFSIRW